MEGRPLIDVLFKEERLMLLIRDRDELKRYVEQMASMAAAEAKANERSPTASHHAQGRCYAAEQILMAIKAWEDFDLAEATCQAMRDAVKAQREKDEFGKKPREWRV
jgi:uncharacterized protein YdiU (UPF0061 family)